MFKEFWKHNYKLPDFSDTINLKRKKLIFLSIVILWALLIIFVYYKKLWNFDPGFNFSFKIPDLPYLNEALFRNVSSIVGAGILILSSLLLGNFLLKHTGLSLNFSERLFFGAAFGFGIYAYIGFFLALFGFYKAEVLQVLSVIPVFGGLLYWIKNRRYLSFIPERIAWNKRELLWWFCSGVAILFAFIGALAPEREFDALWYHLAYPQRYLENGYLVDLPDDYVSLYPMTFELWYGYGLALGGQITAKLLHFACLPIIALGITSLVKRFVVKTSPALSVALFVTIPTVIWEASTAYIELAMTLYLLLMLYALFCFIEEKKKSWLIIAGLNLGLAMACKHLALIPFLLISTGFIFFSLKNKEYISGFIIFCCIAVAVALPWYIRSFLATGNPFFPELFNIFGAPPDRWNIHTQIGLENFLERFGPPGTFLNYLILPWHMTIHAASFHGTLGPLFLILLPFVIFVRQRSVYFLILITFVFLYIVFWASPLSSFQMRFLIPVAPILAILAASSFKFIESLTENLTRFLKFMIYSGLFLLLILNLPPFTAFHEHDRQGWNNWLNSVLHGVNLDVVVGAESKDEYLSKNLASYKVWKFVNQNLPEDSYILTWSNGDQFYSQHSRIWIYATSMNSVSRAQDKKQVLYSLFERGITDIILDKRDKYADEMVLFSPAALSTWYEKLYEDRYYILYHIQWDKLEVSETNP